MYLSNVEGLKREIATRACADRGTVGFAAVSQSAKQRGCGGDRRVIIPVGCPLPAVHTTGSVEAGEVMCWGSNKGAHEPLVDAPLSRWTLVPFSRGMGF